MLERYKTFQPKPNAIDELKKVLQTIWDDRPRNSIHTRRDRSRGIRDEATACEQEVVSRLRTWPPRPVAHPSRATGRPLGTKYDNIDQNKAKKEGPGALEAKPEVKIWRPDFLTRRPRFLIWPPTHHNVYLIPLPSFTVLTSKVGQSTQLLPVLQFHFRFDHDVFRFTINFTTFRTISGTFENTSGFWIVLSGHRFRFGAPSFLIESISSRRYAIPRQYRPE